MVHRRFAENRSLTTDNLGGPPSPFFGLSGLFSVTCTLDYSRQVFDSKGFRS